MKIEMPCDQYPKVAVRDSTWTTFKRAPIAMQVFMLFCLCALIVSNAMPWISFLPSIPNYIFNGTLYIVPLSSCYSALSKPGMFRTNIYCAVGALLLQVFLLQVVFVLPSPSLSLTARQLHSVLQPALDVVLPVFCAMLLLSPSMLKWIHARDESGDGVHQVTVADLLYLMFIVSLAMASLLCITRTSFP